MTRKEEYQEYLKSDHWKKLKAKKNKCSEYRDNKRCAICGENNKLDLHHLVYKNWTDVDTKDLRWLCRQCHEIAHYVLKNKPIKISERIKKGREFADKNQRLYCLTKRLVLRERKKLKIGMGRSAHSAPI